MDRTARIWPLAGNPAPPGRTLFQAKSFLTNCVVSSYAALILVCAYRQGNFLVSADGGPTRELAGFTEETGGLAFSADGRFAAAAGGGFEPRERQIRIWDVASQEVVTILEVGEQPYPVDLQFVPEGQIMSSSSSGLLRWNVENGTRELLLAGDFVRFSTDRYGEKVLLVDAPSEVLGGRVQLLNVETGEVVRLPQFGDDVNNVRMDPLGTFAVTGANDGDLHVGNLDGQHHTFFLETTAL